MSKTDSQKAKEGRMMRREVILSESELAAKLIETAQVIVLLLDTEANIVRINPYMEELTGYLQNEIVGKNWFDVFIPDDQKKKLKALFIQAIGDVPTMGNINTIIIKGGNEREIIWYDSILRDHKGAIIGLVAVGHDITEQRKREEASRITEAQLSNAMEIARLGYWEYDVTANLFRFNDQFYAIFRTNVEEVGSYTLTPEQYANKFLYPDDRKMVFEETKMALTTTDPNFSRHIEHRIFYADGEIGYISVRYFIVKDKEGRTIKTYGANQDITEQKMNEKKLAEQNERYIALNERLKESLDHLQAMNIELEKAKLKAEESDQLKSSFLANMSHEIRTPMNGIIGFSNMLSKPNLSDERKQQYIQIINDMSKQLLHLIDDIIDISMIETGQIKIRNSEININDLFLKLFSIYQPLAARNNICLFIKKDLPDDAAILNCDAIKLRQILDNLLTNAFKFSHEGYVELGYLRHEYNLVFYVKDSGIGIAPKMQKCIFDRFVQAETGVTKSYGGAGLGLAITKAFVEKMNGKIWLESEPGKGSTFYFSLPYKERVSEPIPVRRKISVIKESARPVILVVEDEEINYIFLEELLINQPYTILHAKNGREAIDFCKNRPEINLVLMDIKLPDLNGIDAMRKIKALRRKLPVLAQTAYALPGDKELAMESGFDDYISKPIDEEELLGKIKSFLKRRSVDVVKKKQRKNNR